MDRGRAGGYITDNNFSGIQVRKKMQREHEERLEKIKERKPGSSITLDNNPPVIIKAALSNPRKHATKDYFNFITEAENKSLLKRISTILTAPPKITDKEYKDMKKLCVTAGRGLKAQYEQKLVDKKNKAFFEHLRKTKAYYKAKDWENDYKKQKFNQKFMKQVKYRRPSGFKDKFLEEQKKEEEEKLKRQKLSASHVDRIREYKAKLDKMKRSTTIGSRSPCSSTVSSIAPTRSRSGTNGSGTGLHSHYHDGGRGHSGNHQNINGTSSYDKSDYADDFFEEYDNKKGELNYEHQQQTQGNNNNHQQQQQGSRIVNFELSNTTQQQPVENRVPLASTQRIIKVCKQNSVTRHHDGPMPGGNRLDNKNDITEEILFLNANIECFLINRDYLVVTVICYIDDETLEVEAEISSQELSAFSTGDMKPASNLAFLSEVAEEVVDNVEVKVDIHSEARLVLNLFSDDVDNDSDNASDVNRWNSINSVQLSNNEELNQILLPDKMERIFSGGICLNAFFLTNMSQSIGNFNMLVDLAKKAQRFEPVYAFIRICSSYDDQLFVTAYTVSTTNELFKKTKRPAIPAGTTLKLYVPLPSIVQADPEMIFSFAENLSQNLKIEHDCRTGHNTLCLATPAAN